MPGRGVSRIGVRSRRAARALARAIGLFNGLNALKHTRRRAREVVIVFPVQPEIPGHTEISVGVDENVVAINVALIFEVARP